MTNDNALLGAVDRLHRWIELNAPLVIAFSGGVDSSLLLTEAVAAVGRTVTAVTLRGAQFPADETRRAARIASSLGVEIRWLELSPGEIPAFKNNPADRCYHCKRALFSRLLNEAKGLGISCVVEGSHIDDAGSYRPGMRALKELGVFSPLALSGFNKEMIRARSRELELETAELPSCACLATRIPYGDKVTESRMNRIDRAESALRSLGFAQLRVRDYKDTARIELMPEDIERAFSLEMRERIVTVVTEVGYKYVSIDLSGYRESIPDTV